MNLNKIEMLNGWVLVKTDGPDDEGVVVKSEVVGDWEDKAGVWKNRLLIPIGTVIRFLGKPYNTKLLPLTEDSIPYVAVKYEDIIYKETK